VALRGRTTVRLGLIDKWSYAPTQKEDRVWRTALQLYGHFGRPPCIPEISAVVELPASEIIKHLRQLEERDLLALDPDSETLLHIYPFNGRTTGHLTTMGGCAFNSMCAVDALGTGAMYGCDVDIISACRHCKERIRITTANMGEALGRASPDSSVIWYELTYRQSAAVSCCQATAFFCSDEHLERWFRAQKSRRAGLRLSLVEALEVGRAIFGPVLRRAQ